jgi:hypothetical protein
VKRLTVMKTEWRNWTFGISWDVKPYASFVVSVGPFSAAWVPDPNTYYWKR